MREAPSLVVLQELGRRGAKLHFTTRPPCRRRQLLQSARGIVFAADQNAARREGDDALVIVTEWCESSEVPISSSSVVRSGRL
jgi:UDPglucose 6-dehydrogenase